MIIGSGSLTASSSACRVLLHVTEGNSLFGLVVLGFFLKEIHLMQLRGLSVRSAASTPCTGIFEPVSWQDDSCTAQVPLSGSLNLFGVSRAVGSMDVQYQS